MAYSNIFINTGGKENSKPKPFVVPTSGIAIATFISAYILCLKFEPIYRQTLFLFKHMFLKWDEYDEHFKPIVMLTGQIWMIFLFEIASVLLQC